MTFQPGAAAVLLASVCAAAKIAPPSGRSSVSEPTIMMGFLAFCSCCAKGCFPLAIS